LMMRGFTESPLMRVKNNSHSNYHSTLIGTNQNKIQKQLMNS